MYPEPFRGGLSMSDEMLSAIRRYKPVQWAMIPDFGLYMDQVITFISQMYAPLYGEDPSKYLSASMINNYVKSKLIPRPDGKKYSREQIALLTMIVVLKQVASMEDIRKMLTLKEGESVEMLYNAFCDRFQQVILTLQDSRQAGSALSAALDYAILASGFHGGCMAALDAEKA